MSTVGDIWRTALQNPDLPDTIRVGRATYIEVGPPEGLVADAIRQTMPGVVFKEGDWVTFTDADITTFADELTHYIVNDTFDGTALNEAYWHVVAGTPFVAGGKLHLPNTGPPQTYLRLNFLQRFTGLTFTLHGLTFTEATNYTGLRSRGMRVENPGYTTDHLQIAVSNGSVLCYVGGQTTTVAPYDAIAHRSLRIREAGGKVYFEASADGVAWVVLREIARPGWVDALDARYAIWSGAYNVLGSDQVGEAVFERVTLA